MRTNNEINRLRRSIDPINVPILTRALLESEGIEAILGKDAPGLRLLTETEREISLRDLLLTKPPGDVWLFGYGSLIWNPAIRTVDRRIARIEGWHRAFCVSATAGRGSPEKPGLVLGLDLGGTCIGTAYRVANADVETELPLLWRREMLCGAYVPRWVDVIDQNGICFGSAIAFMINHNSDQYVGDLTVDMIVHRLATATGGLGSAADYLFRTRDGLRTHGIPDIELEEIAERVEIFQARNRDVFGATVE